MLLCCIAGPGRGLPRRPQLAHVERKDADDEHGTNDPAQRQLPIGIHRTASAANQPDVGVLNGPAADRDRQHEVPSTSAPRPAHICAGTRPHLRRDSPTSAAGLALWVLCSWFEVSPVPVQMMQGRGKCRCAQRGGAQSRGRIGWGEPAPGAGVSPDVGRADLRAAVTPASPAGGSYRHTSFQYLYLRLRGIPHGTVSHTPFCLT